MNGYDKENLFREPINFRPASSELLRVVSRPTPPELIPNSENKPVYSLKVTLWIYALVFLFMGSGIALGFMKGCR